MDADATAQHETPAWRDRADFIIGAVLDEPGKWEQLWSRQLGPRRFELCCIPFLAYGLALGDVVETKAQDGREHLVAEVVEPSGRFTMRVSFLDTSVAAEVAEVLTGPGALLEWRGHRSRMLAVDAADAAMTHAVADALRPYEDAERVAVETASA